MLNEVNTEVLKVPEGFKFVSQGKKATSMLSLVRFTLTRVYLEPGYVRTPEEYYFLLNACPYLAKIGGSFKEIYGESAVATCELFVLQRAEPHHYQEDLVKLGVDKFLRAVFSWNEYKSWKGAKPEQTPQIGWFVFRTL